VISVWFCFVISKMLQRTLLASWSTCTTTNLATKKTTTMIWVWAARAAICWKTCATPAPPCSTRWSVSWTPTIAACRRPTLANRWSSRRTSVWPRKTMTHRATRPRSDWRHHSAATDRRWNWSNLRCLWMTHRPTTIEIRCRSMSHRRPLYILWMLGTNRCSSMTMFHHRLPPKPGQFSTKVWPTTTVLPNAVTSLLVRSWTATVTRSVLSKYRLQWDNPELSIKMCENWPARWRARRDRWRRLAPVTSSPVDASSWSTPRCAPWPARRQSRRRRFSATRASLCKCKLLFGVFHHFFWLDINALWNMRMCLFFDFLLITPKRSADWLGRPSLCCKVYIYLDTVVSWHKFKIT